MRKITDRNGDEDDDMQAYTMVVQQYPRNKMRKLAGFLFELIPIHCCPFPRVGGCYFEKKKNSETTNRFRMSGWDERPLVVLNFSAMSSPHLLNRCQGAPGLTSGAIRYSHSGVCSRVCPMGMGHPQRSCSPFFFSVLVCHTQVTIHERPSLHFGPLFHLNPCRCLSQSKY